VTKVVGREEEERRERERTRRRGREERVERRKTLGGYSLRLDLFSFSEASLSLSRQNTRT